MAIIKKFKVIKMACFSGLFGVFIGLFFGIISSVLTLIIPTFSTLKIWQLLFGIPVGYGVMMFLIALIFTPIANLALKIIKGLDLDLIESVVKKTATIKNIEQGKQEQKKIPEHPVKSVLNPQPIPQMTNSKTTQKSVSGMSTE